MGTGPQGQSPPTLYAVGNPDVFDLRRVGEDGAAAGLPGVEPVAALGAADPGAFQSLGGEAFDFGAAFKRTVVAPDGVDVAVAGEGAGQFVGAAADDVQHTPRQVGGVEHLVEVQ